MSERPAEPDGPDRTAKAWADRRNLAERLFPGPSNPMSKQAADHVQRLIRTRGVQPDALPSPTRDPRDGRPVHDTAPPVGPEDLAAVREALDTQNELLRALLASSTDAQTDARSTAQNSRTFAWAGTVIALLTLVATIVLIVGGG